MKVREVLEILKKDGWYIARTRGSHRQLKHSRKGGVVTVAGKSNIDIPIKTLKSIFKQAGLE